MRPNQQNNKQRSRGRNNNNQRRSGGGGNPLSRNYESNGPDVKIRGNAAHVAEKYTQLSRDAASVGDNVMAENYLQHAEHYNRIILAAQAQFQPRQDHVVDTGSDEDEDGDQIVATTPSEDQAQPEAAEAGNEEQGEPRQRRQRRPRRERSEEEVAAASVPAEEVSAEPEAVNAEAAPEEKRPTRTRRAKPAAAEAAGGETAEEDAPKPRARRTRRPKADEGEGEPVGELPAFLTAGREAAAE